MRNSPFITYISVCSMKLPLVFIIGELNGVDNVVEYAINGRLIIEEQTRLHRLYSPSSPIVPRAILSQDNFLKSRILIRAVKSGEKFLERLQVLR